MLRTSYLNVRSRLTLLTEPHPKKSSSASSSGRSRSFRASANDGRTSSPSCSVGRSVKETQKHPSPSTKPLTYHGFSGDIRRWADLVVTTVGRVACCISDSRVALVPREQRLQSSTSLCPSAPYAPVSEGVRRKRILEPIEGPSAKASSANAIVSVTCVLPPHVCTAA